MRKEIEELRPKLKEILYDCAIELKATKAALYLLDGDRGKFSLVTEYGFRSAARSHTDSHNPIVDRCGRGRVPFLVNGVAAEPRFAEVLFEASSDRLIVAPLFTRGQLIGYIDARDKAARQPFEGDDIARAQKIADRVVELVGSRNIFGLQFLALSEAEEDAPLLTSSGASQWLAIPGSAFISGSLSAPAASSKPRPVKDAPTIVPASVVAKTAPAAAKGAPLPPPSQRLASVIAAARASMQSVLDPAAREQLTETELGIAREILRSMLAVPGVLCVAFTAFEQMGGVTEVASKGLFTSDAAEYLQGKLHSWLVRRRETISPVQLNVQPPTVTSEPPITRPRIPKVFTAPVVVSSLRGLYLTVGFSGPPDRASHEMLASMLTQLQVAIEHSMQQEALALVRAKIVDSLLEPDFQKLPDLRRHSEAVAAMAVSFAEFLSMSAADVESVRTIAMLHDVGMRLLGYDRLYTSPQLTDDEVEILREHSVVGAAMVEPLLGSDVARAILTHHLRVDGGGYPTDLRGYEIPLATRIIQICDAYASMTNGGGYRTPKSHPDAIAALQQGAGSEFDSELVERFVEMHASRA